MATLAVVNSTTNICENVVVVDSGSTWTPPAGYYTVDIDGVEAGIGWYYDQASNVWTGPAVANGSFSPNPVQINESTTLSWTSVNATSVTISTLPGQTFGASGSVPMTFSSIGSKSVMLTAAGLAGSNSTKVSVSVQTTVSADNTSGATVI